MRIGVVTGPGTSDDDARAALAAAGHEAVPLAPDEHDLHRVDGVVLVAAMPADAALLRDLAIGVDRGMPLLGLGAGAAFLVDSGLLPGAVLPGEGGTRDVEVRETDTAWTTGFAAGDVVALPVSADTARWVLGQETASDLAAERRIVATFADGAVAGLANVHGNVVGLLARPDRAVVEDGPDPAAVVWFERAAAMLRRSPLT